MKSVPGKRLAKLALGKGWELKRVNGSHHVFTKQGRSERLVIPIHGNKSGAVRKFVYPAYQRK